ncbi:phosphoribosylformylglycinamidine synthase I [Microbacterium proteolyticum]|nr:phosphoribosylformylglycinamidine synthase I [Microbacterium proteolyticum]
MTARIGVITFPGSLDDRDAQRAIRLAGGEPVALWHGEHDLKGVDALVLPGGFSYGDYLRAGAIAAFAPIMAEVKDAAAKGMPVLGICNGFQMLVEAHLLPGGLIRNAHQQFIRRDQRLRVENASTAWTSDFAEGDEIVIPLKNADGGYIADAETLARVNGEGLVTFRYLGVNPNGSLDDIAGLTNERGNVVGLMPHPEHAVEPGFGPAMPAAMRSGRRRPGLLHLGDRRRGGRRGLSPFARSRSARSA